MKFTKNLRAYAAALAVSLSPQMAGALALNDYNLILSGDYVYSGSSVWGHSIIGGDLAGSGGEFGSRLPRNTTDNSLTVVGDIRSSNINLMAGNLVHGGTIHNTTISNNGTGTVRQDASLDISGIIEELVDASSTYSSKAANGLFNSSTSVFSYSGADDVAFFNVSAGDVFKNNANLKLQAGSAKSVIINVGGAEVTAGGGINFGTGFSRDTTQTNLGASNILWNFYEATKLDLGDFGFVGSVLAMNAAVTNIGTLDGTLAAASLLGDRQLHNYYFNDPNLPPSVVPLPASFYLMLTGVACLLFGRVKFKTKNA